MYCTHPPTYLSSPPTPNKQPTLHHMVTPLTTCLVTHRKVTQLTPITSIHLPAALETLWSCLCVRSHHYRLLPQHHLHLLDVPDSHHVVPHPLPITHSEGCTIPPLSVHTVMHLTSNHQSAHITSIPRGGTQETGAWHALVHCVGGPRLTVRWTEEETEQVGWTVAGGKGRRTLDRELDRKGSWHIFGQGFMSRGAF